MKALPSTIMSSLLPEEKKVLALTAKLAESKVALHELRYDRRRKENFIKERRLEDVIYNCLSDLTTITSIKGCEYSQAMNFSGYRVFIKDPSGNVFALRSDETYTLVSNKIRVKVPSTRCYDSTDDIRVAYALMFNKCHHSVVGTRVVLLSVNESFNDVHISIHEVL